MLLNKNVGKKILVGVAAVALFAPVALGGGQAHASLQDAFNKASSQQALDKSAQEGREMEKAQGAWADAHPKESDTVGSAGGTSSSDNATSSKNSHQDEKNVSNSDYDATLPNNQTFHKNRTTKSYKNDKSKDVKYPKAPKYKKGHSKKINKRKFTKKIIRLHKKGFSNKKIAKKLGIHVSMVKHVLK